MSGRYLTDLAATVADAGLTVIEMDGWQTRARGSGGYSSGRPTHVMIHHTASGPSSDGWPDANYCTHGSENRPIANLYLNRAGTVWVMAAGCTNTNGQGGPLDQVPADAMNSYAIGIEAGNDGIGEAWPHPQQDAYLVLCAALCDHYGIPHGQVRSHAEWAPGRKVDPAGPSRWAASGTWDEHAFRDDLPDAGQAPPSTRRHNMYIYLRDEEGAYYAGDMVTIRWLDNGPAVDNYAAQLTVYGYIKPGQPPLQVPRQDVLDGNWGVPVGVMPHPI